MSNNVHKKIKYDLEDIILFTHIAKLRNFRRAAEKMGIAPSTATGKINELEKSLGVSLFARTTKEVNLTNEGRALFDRCIEIVKTLKSMKDIEEELESGKLTILLPDYEVLNKTKFYIVYPSSKYISPKIRAFIDFFQDKLHHSNKTLKK